jgi:hypothetical protein
MTDTLSAEEREALFKTVTSRIETCRIAARIYSDAKSQREADMLSELLRLAKLATPELIALGEAAAYWVREHDLQQNTLSGDIKLFGAARAYAASVSPPSEEQP